MATLQQRKVRIRMAAAWTHIEIGSLLQLERDLDDAKTHAELDKIEDELDSSEAVADEEELFG